MAGGERSPRSTLLSSEPMPVLIHGNKNGNGLSATFMHPTPMEQVLVQDGAPSVPSTPVYHMYCASDFMSNGHYDMLRSWFRVYGRTDLIIASVESFVAGASGSMASIFQTPPAEAEDPAAKYPLDERVLLILDSFKNKLDPGKQKVVREVLGKYCYLTRSGNVRSSTPRSPSSRDHVCVIQGPPGSGKTRLISAIVQMIMLLDENCAFLIGAESNAAVDAVQKAVLSEAMRNPSMARNVTDLFTRLESTARRKESACVCATEDGKASNLPLEELRRRVKASEKSQSPCICWDTHVLLSRNDHDSRASGANARLRNNRVVFGTHAMLMHDFIPTLLEKRSAVVVVQDESSQSIDLSALGPLSMLPESCPVLLVVVGDDKQLSPTVIHDRMTIAEFPFVADALSRTLYDILRDLGHRPRMLNKQYRMHPDICRFISTQFYEDKLHTADDSFFHSSGNTGSCISQFLNNIKLQASSPARGRSGQASDYEDSAVTFFTLKRASRQSSTVPGVQGHQHAAYWPIYKWGTLTGTEKALYGSRVTSSRILSRAIPSTGDLQAKSSVLNKSRYVLAEVEFVVDLTCRLLLAVHARKNPKVSQTGMPILPSGEFSILLVSPYRAQVDKIGELLKSSLVPLSDETSWMRKAVRCISIDAAQGSQATVVIVSLGIDAMSDMSKFLEDARRSNVAISRAREAAILVGSIGGIRRGTSDSPWRSFVEFCEERGRCFAVMK